MENKNDIRDLQMKLYELQLEIRSYEHDILKHLPSMPGWRDNIGMLLALKKTEYELLDAMAATANYDELINSDNCNAFKCYEQNIGNISPAIADGIKQHLNNGLTKELVCEAIKDAARNNRRSWRYIDSILADKERKGIKTLEEYVNEREEYRKNKANQKNKQQQKATDNKKRCENG